MLVAADKMKDRDGPMRSNRRPPPVVLPAEGGRQQNSMLRTATRAAIRIRKEFGVPDEATVDLLVRAFRAAVRPRQQAGRKPDQATARAAHLFVCAMEAHSIAKYPQLRLYQRLVWQRIYREVIPDFAQLDKLTRQYRSATLRRNVKACLRRQGCKWAQGIRVSTVNRSGKRVLSTAPQKRSL
jgi:hypothetical protein